jgi:hypothetical protein
MLRHKARRAEGYDGCCRPTLVRSGRSTPPHAPTALIPKESTSPLPKSTLNRWRIRLDVASGSNRGEKGDGYFFAAFLSGIQAPAATAGRLEAPPFPFDMSGGAEGATSGAARQSVSSATVARIGSWYRRRRHR